MNELARGGCNTSTCLAIAWSVCACAAPAQTVRTVASTTAPARRETAAASQPAPAPVPEPEREVGPDCPWGQGETLPTSEPPGCPAWRDGDEHYRVVLVREGDIALTWGSILRTEQFPRTREGWNALREALHRMVGLQSSTTFVASSTGSLGAVVCGASAVRAAGYHQVRPCTLAPDFVVDADGTVHPPSPESRAAGVPWRSRDDVVASCHVRGQDRCEEYLRSDRMTTELIALFRENCRRIGRWSDGVCPANNLAGICDRSEQHARITYRYLSRNVNDATVRESCDEGFFRPAVPAP